MTAPSSSQVIRGRIEGRPFAIKQKSAEGHHGKARWAGAGPPRTAEASIEPSSQGVPKKVFTKAHAMPKLLGSISVGKREWLAEMIRKVYGVFTLEYLKIVVKENREIEDPDFVIHCQVIRFPAVPVALAPLTLRSKWVEISRKETLQDAYLFLKRHSSRGFPLRLVPIWNNRQGLKFSILYGRHFKDEKSARKGLRKLPSAFVSGAKILSGWEKDTTFFASPMA